MERFRGYPVRRESVAVGPRVYVLWMPVDSYELLGDPRVLERFAQDEYLPYWAALWPAALLLADAVAAWPPAPRAAPPLVLELGCGVGLVGLVAADRGYRVLLSDYDKDALAFAALNARNNGLAPVQTRHLDWRRAYPDLRADRILAADVLYEARNLLPVARFVAAHLAAGGTALLADANRSVADPFPSIAQACGLTVKTTPAERSGAPPGTAVRGRIFACSL
jgi:predicted nicotinamide N-methyase